MVELHTGCFANADRATPGGRKSWSLDRLMAAIREGTRAAGCRSTRGTGSTTSNITQLFFVPHLVGVEHRAHHRLALR